MCDNNTSKNKTHRIRYYLTPSPTLVEYEFGSKISLRRPRRPDAGHFEVRFAGPASLPAPRAPFLSAREGPQGPLSR